MGEDLFEQAAAERMKREAPLARRVAPRSLDEIVGQDRILGPGRILRRAIEADRVTSLILYGPPGSGKTALARVIAMRTKAAFEAMNAVISGVKEPCRGPHAPHVQHVVLHNISQYRPLQIA